MRVAFRFLSLQDCREGHTGIMCQACLPSTGGSPPEWYRAVSGLCKPCKEASWTTLIILCSAITLSGLFYAWRLRMKLQAVGALVKQDEGEKEEEEDAAGGEGTADNPAVRKKSSVKKAKAHAKHAKASHAVQRALRLVPFTHSCTYVCNSLRTTLGCTTGYVRPRSWREGPLLFEGAPHPHVAT